MSKIVLIGGYSFRETILRKINQILLELEKISGRKIEWENILMFLAKSEGEISEIELQEELSNLFEAIPFEKILKGIEYLEKSIESFPTKIIYKNLCLVQNRNIKEKNTYLGELKNVLSELATPTIRIWKDVILLPLI